MRCNSKIAGKSKPRGQSIVEAVVGTIVIILIVMGLADVIIVIQAGMVNGDLAARAARAAANQSSTQALADAALAQVNTNFPTSSIIPNVVSLKVQLNTPATVPPSQLTVDSIINVKIPFPIPLVIANPIQLHTQSVAPMLN